MLFPLSVEAASDAVCLGCHGDPTLTIKVKGKVKQLYVKEKDFAASVHGGNSCISCHKDAKDFPHPLPVKKVNCGDCHDAIEKRYRSSLHGQALARGDRFAPECFDCHTKHNILPKKDPKSPSYVMNMPAMCGRCHAESSEVVKTHKEISQHNVLDNYSMSVHGEAIFHKGLLVSATCSSCHTAHDVYPHEDQRSSIHRNNIAKTCMQCHVNIEKVHAKVVRGRLWETAPGRIPVCIECHPAHKIRRAFYAAERIDDAICMKCHSNPALVKKKEGRDVSLFVDIKAVRNSIHGSKGIPCVKCHFNVDLRREPLCRDSGRIDCSVCHAEQVKQFENSIHSRLLAEKNPDAPSCTTCHDKHFTLSKKDINSPTFARNVPNLCARCHREGEKAAIVHKGKEGDVIRHYRMSTHGKGLFESGLMVTATCTSCHTAHKILPSREEGATTNRKNILETCAQCHLGIAEKFKKSIHSPLISKTDKKLPVCIDCHESHTIERVDKATFREQIVKMCGACHKEDTDSYFETYHGKASLLIGGAKIAKCSDCHGDHDILPPKYPESHLSRKNIVKTCQKCHPDAGRKFAGYLTHATHHDKDKFPMLFYTFWAMTALLIGTFTFFGLHVLFWIPRSFRQRFLMRRRHKSLKSPLLSIDDILDYQQFLSRLKEESELSEPGPGKRLWDLLDENTKNCINEVLSKGVEPTIEQKSCIIEALNAILSSEDLSVFKFDNTGDEARGYLNRGNS